MPEPLVLDRPDQFHALGDPTRMRILGVLGEAPSSVQDLAARLSTPKGTIAHHVKVLERAGLIQVARTRRVRGVEEKQYARAAGRLEVRDIGSDPDHAASTLLMANYPLRHALAEALPLPGADEPVTSVIMRARMPATRARRFAKMVRLLAAEFADGAPGHGETYGFVAAVYVPDWAARPSGGDEP